MPIDEEYVRHLESRLAILRQNVDHYSKEAQAWREKYEGVEHRIEALEMIVADVSVTAEPPVGRTLWVKVTLDEHLILQNKDKEDLAEMTIGTAWKKLAFELKNTLIAGELKGNRVPMLRRARWIGFTDKDL